MPTNVFDIKQLIDKTKIFNYMTNKNLFSKCAFVRKMVKHSSQTSARPAREWLKYAAAFLLIFTVGVGISSGTEYTYTSFTTKFTKGTTNGTGISQQLSSSVSLTTIASDGASNFASKVTDATNSYYQSTGVGLRISKNKGAGNFTLTLSNALKDSAIYAIVI